MDEGGTKRVLAITDINDSTRFNKQLNHWADLHLGGGKRCKLDQPKPTIQDDGSIHWESQPSGWGPPTTPTSHEPAQEPHAAVGLIHPNAQNRCRVAYPRAALEDYPANTPNTQCEDWQCEFTGEQMPEDSEDVYASVASASQDGT